MTREEQVSEVDLWLKYGDSEAFARDIWQLLFNEYRFHSADIQTQVIGLNHMGDMLCDYTFLCNSVKKKWIDLEIWWNFHGNLSYGVTEITDLYPAYIDGWKYHGKFISDEEKGILKFTLFKLIKVDEIC